MNKVVTINLNGNAYQLDEAAYEALRAYLDKACRSLAANPDRDEIIADIEQSIAGRCRATLGANRTVVAAKSLESILADMGPIVDVQPTEMPGGPERLPVSESESVRTKRLFRVKAGAILGGVCNGFAAYFNLDPAMVRLGLILLTLFGGSGILVYLVAWLVIPEATTASEVAAAHGGASTAEDVIRRAKQGYYEGIKAYREKGRWVFLRNVLLLLAGSVLIGLTGILSLQLLKGTLRFFGYGGFGLGSTELVIVLLPFALLVALLFAIVRHCLRNRG